MKSQKLLGSLCLRGILAWPESAMSHGHRTSMPASCKDTERVRQRCVDELHHGVSSQGKGAEDGSLAVGSTGGALSRKRDITKDEAKLIPGEAVGLGGFLLEKLTARNV